MGLVFIINILFRFLEFLILARVIISWIGTGSYDPTWRKILTFVYKVTEPILGPIRRLLPQGNIGIDFSPLVALILLGILHRFLVNLLYF